MDWRVEITTDGGFTGRGIGSVAITAETLACHEALPALVASARPKHWKRDYPRKRGADLIRYTLTLTRGDERHSASWEGEGQEGLPPDLRALFREAWRKCD